MNIFVTARVPNRKTGREEGREGGRDKFCLLDESFSLFFFFSSKYAIKSSQET